MKLFDLCRECGAEITINKELVGAYCKIQQICGCCYWSCNWQSSNAFRNVKAVNIDLAAAILFSATIPTKALRLFKIIGVPMFSLRTYLRHQKTYLLPTILHCWKSEQKLLLEEILSRDNKSVQLGGDARCDSPGSSAKFGTYTMMDLETGKVIDIKIVQSNEVGGSHAIELEGLEQSLRFLDEYGVVVKTCN